MEDNSITLPQSQNNDDTAYSIGKRTEDADIIKSLEITFEIRTLRFFINMVPSLVQAAVIKNYETVQRVGAVASSTRGVLSAVSSGISSAVSSRISWGINKFYWSSHDQTADDQEITETPKEDQKDSNNLHSAIEFLMKHPIRTVMICASQKELRDQFFDAVKKIGKALLKALTKENSDLNKLLNNNLEFLKSNTSSSYSFVLDPDIVRAILMLAVKDLIRLANSEISTDQDNGALVGELICHLVELSQFKNMDRAKREQCARRATNAVLVLLEKNCIDTSEYLNVIINTDQNDDTKKKITDFIQYLKHLADGNNELQQKFQSLLYYGFCHLYSQDNPNQQKEYLLSILDNLTGILEILGDNKTGDKEHSPSESDALDQIFSLLNSEELFNFMVSFLPEKYKVWLEKVYKHKMNTSLDGRNLFKIAVINALKEIVLSYKALEEKYIKLEDEAIIQANYQEERAKLQEKKLMEIYKLFFDLLKKDAVYDLVDNKLFREFMRLNFKEWLELEKELVNFNFHNLHDNSPLRQMLQAFKKKQGDAEHPIPVLVQSGMGHAERDLFDYLLRIINQFDQNREKLKFIERELQEIDLKKTDDQETSDRKNALTQEQQNILLEQERFREVDPEKLLNAYQLEILERHKTLLCYDQIMDTIFNQADLFLGIIKDPKCRNDLIDLLWHLYSMYIVDSKEQLPPKELVRSLKKERKGKIAALINHYVEAPEALVVLLQSDVLYDLTGPIRSLVKGEDNDASPYGHYWLVCSLIHQIKDTENFPTIVEQGLKFYVQSIKNATIEDVEVRRKAGDKALLDLLKAIIETPQILKLLDTTVLETLMTSFLEESNEEVQELREEGNKPELFSVIQMNAYSAFLKKLFPHITKAEDLREITNFSLQYFYHAKSLLYCEENQRADHIKNKRLFWNQLLNKVLSDSKLRGFIVQIILADESHSLEAVLLPGEDLVEDCLTVQEKKDRERNRLLVSLLRSSTCKKLFDRKLPSEDEGKLLSLVLYYYSCLELYESLQQDTKRSDDELFQARDDELFQANYISQMALYSLMQYMLQDPNLIYEIIEHDLIQQIINYLKIDDEDKKLMSQREVDSREKSLSMLSFVQKYRVNLVQNPELLEALKTYLSATYNPELVINYASDDAITIADKNKKSSCILGTFIEILIQNQKGIDLISKIIEDPDDLSFLISKNPDTSLDEQSSRKYVLIISLLKQYKEFCTELDDDTKKEFNELLPLFLKYYAVTLQNVVHDHHDLEERAKARENNEKAKIEFWRELVKLNYTTKSKLFEFVIRSDLDELRTLLIPALQAKHITERVKRQQDYYDVLFDLIKKVLNKTKDFNLFNDVFDWYVVTCDPESSAKRNQDAYEKLFKSLISKGDTVRKLFDLIIELLRDPDNGLGKIFRMPDEELEEWPSKAQATLLKNHVLYEIIMNFLASMLEQEKYLDIVWNAATYYMKYYCGIEDPESETFIQFCLETENIELMRKALSNYLLSNQNHNLGGEVGQVMEILQDPSVLRAWGKYIDGVFRHIEILSKSNPKPDLDCLNNLDPEARRQRMEQHNNNAKEIAMEAVLYCVRNIKSNPELIDGFARICHVVVPIIAEKIKQDKSYSEAIGKIVPNATPAMCARFLNCILFSIPEDLKRMKDERNNSGGKGSRINSFLEKLGRSDEGRRLILSFARNGLSLYTVAWIIFGRDSIVKDIRSIIMDFIWQFCYFFAPGWYKRLVIGDQVLIALNARAKEPNAAHKNPANLADYLRPDGNMSSFLLNNLELSDLRFDGTTWSALNLAGCNFENSVFRGSSFIGCSFNWTNFTNARFERNVRFEGCTFDLETLELIKKEPDVVEFINCTLRTSSDCKDKEVPIGTRGLVSSDDLKIVKDSETVQDNNPDSKLDFRTRLSRQPTTGPALGKSLSREPTVPSRNRTHVEKFNKETIIIN